MNKSGKFNVPIGRYTNPTICDEVNLRACARALRSETLVEYANDFEVTTAGAREGDFVYFDPPYVPTNDTSNFTAYTVTGFSLDDQRRLVACARRLRDRGVHVLLSNADLPVVREMYEGFQIRSVEARRNINSKADRRGPVGELIIWG